VEKRLEPSVGCGGTAFLCVL